VTWKFFFNALIRTKVATVNQTATATPATSVKVTTTATTTATVSELTKSINIKDDFDELHY
jgi:hypothetical protein